LLRLSFFSRHSPLLYSPQRPPSYFVAPASSRLCLGVRRLDAALSALCRGGACPARPSRITPNPSFRAEQADFLFRVCSCKSVGLRSEESLFCLLPTHSSLATALSSAAKAALVFRSAGFPPPLECGGWTPLSPRFV